MKEIFTKKLLLEFSKGNIQIDFSSDNQDLLSSFVDKIEKIRDPDIRRKNQKLDEDKVIEIRALSLKGLSRRDLAKKFGVSKTTIEKVVTYQTWKDI